MRLFRNGRTRKQARNRSIWTTTFDRMDGERTRTAFIWADPAGVRSRYEATGGMGRENKVGAASAIEIGAAGADRSKYKAVKSTGEARRESVGSGPLHERQGEEQVEAPGQAEEEGRAVCFDPTLNPEERLAW